MTRKEAIAEGYVFYCLECEGLYKVIPNRRHEDGHNGYQVAACRRCGCDMFARLDDDSQGEPQ